MNREKFACFGILAVFCASFVLFPSSAHSAIYKWVDKNGQIHITDYHPGSDEMQGAEEEAVPDKAPQQTPEAQETKQQPAEEKREAPVTQQRPQQNIQPAPEAASSAPSATPKPQMSPQFPKEIPAFPGGKVPQLSPNMLVKFIAMLGAFSLIIGLVFYLFFSACLYAIAKKLDVPTPWLAWIPLVQIWTFVVAAKGTDGQPILWLVGLIVPLLGAFIGIYLWMCITENMGKNKWLGLLTLLPIVNLIFMAWLATLKGPARTPADVIQTG